MSCVTDVILITMGEDGAIRDDEYPNVDKLNEFLGRDNPEIRLLKVDEFAGGSKVIGCDVFMGGINRLNKELFLKTFNSIQWESPESVQLLLKEEGEISFKLYIPKVLKV